MKQNVMGAWRCFVSLSASFEWSHLKILQLIYYQSFDAIYCSLNIQVEVSNV